jgi:hypothetical protein
MKKSSNSEKFVEDASGYLEAGREKLQNQTREIINHVFTFIKKKKATQGSLTMPIQQVQLPAEIIGVPCTSAQQIIKKAEKNYFWCRYLISNTKQEKNIQENILYLHKFNEAVQRTVYNLHSTEKCIPTIVSSRIKLEETIDFQGGSSRMRLLQKK